MHHHAHGSSPRLRGTAIFPLFYPLLTRFIPAPAGNGLGMYLPARAPSVHPRACGERNRIDTPRGDLIGSSPRLRGTVQM